MHGLVRLVWKNFTGPHRVLTSAPSNPFELEQTLRARPSRPTSVLDLTNALMNELTKIPTDTIENLVERQMGGLCYSRKGETNSILMSMKLEWYVITAPVGVMCMWPNTLVHIVYLEA